MPCKWATSTQTGIAPDRLRMTDVPLPDGRRVALELERLRPERLRLGFRVDGVPRPDLLEGRALTIWTGRVVGAPDSEASLSFSDVLCGGWLRLGGEVVHLVARPDAEGRWRGSGGALVTEAGLGRLRPRPEETCRTPELPALPPRPPGPPAGSSGPGAGPSASICLRECTVAIEGDWQLFQVFGDLDTLSVYLTTLLSYVSNRYEVQAGTVLTFPYVGLYTTEDDPWESQDNGGSSLDVLYELLSKWDGQVPEDARLGHLVSGADLGGGVAWLDVLCYGAYNFGVSGNLQGLTQFPVVQQSYNWDFMVIAHEIGHNFSSPHTHDYCPPLDECAPDGYWGTCQGQTACQYGTIMSYCHLCPGGTGNITTWFHPVVVDKIRYRILECLPPYVALESELPPVVVPDAWVVARARPRGAPRSPCACT